MSNITIKVEHIETTIVEFCTDLNGDVHIKCNPKTEQKYLFLSKEHNNFDQLYSKLKCGQTYDFICVKKNYSIADFLDYIYCWGLFNGTEIIDILECKVYSISGIVTGLKNVEYGGLQSYEEIILEPKPKNKRIVLKKDHIPKDIIGKKYNIDCVKTFGYNFYTLY